MGGNCAGRQLRQRYRPPPLPFSFGSLAASAL